MKTIMWLALLGSISLQAAPVRVVHYNIKELDSTKLSQGLSHKQVAAAMNVIKKLKPDFLSLNEMQYDLRNVPTKEYKTVGQNMNRVISLLDLGWSSVNVGFGPANTGTFALKLPGTNDYTTNTLKRELADPYNFGVFPAEYSSAGATRFLIVKTIIEKNILWTTFNPNRDVSKFLDTNGKALDPKKIDLFDKNFMDMVVQIGNKEVHFILLHTVPSHDFDNAGSPNSARNADQLAFLEWYLTGETNFKVPSNLKIKPLKPNDLFVAMGDWNVDVRKVEISGAQVLQSLFKKTKLWMDYSKMQFTYESQPFYVPSFNEQLDYIVTSNSNDIRIVDGGVYAPMVRSERGCDLAKAPKALNKGNTVVSYRDVKTKKTCYAEVSADYAEIKTASDHRPLWVDLEIN